MRFTLPHQVGRPKKTIDPRISAIFFQTTDVECGFRDQNLTKTALRNRLGEKSLDNLMTISTEGPPLSKFDFHEACQI